MENIERPKIKFKNFIKYIANQLFRKNVLKNLFITHNWLGGFSIYSHVSQSTGKPKVMYSKASAKKAAEKMSKKVSERENQNIHFSYYKCIYCDGWHIGKNMQNKVKKVDEN